MNTLAYDPKKSLFSSKEYHEYFIKYFKKRCGTKTSCKIEIMEPKARVGEPDSFDPDNFAGGLDLVSMLSDRCLERIKWLDKTSS